MRVCTLLEQCGCKPVDPGFDNRPCLVSPAGHQWVPATGWLAYPTTQCWLRDGDNTRDAVLDMGLPPGVYQVQEDGCITLQVVIEASA
jgi:hypothetical protein